MKAKSMKQKPVTQEHGAGCSVACTAFVLNLPRYLKKNKLSLLKIPGTIIYLGRSNKYPLGHFLVRTKRGDWMNPWVNFPVIAPAKSAYQKKLPGKPIYAIFSIE